MSERWPSKSAMRQAKIVNAYDAFPRGTIVVDWVGGQAGRGVTHHQCACVHRVGGPNVNPKGAWYDSGNYYTSSFAAMPREFEAYNGGTLKQRKLWHYEQAFGWVRENVPEHSSDWVATPFGYVDRAVADEARARIAAAVRAGTSASVRR